MFKELIKVVTALCFLVLAAPSQALTVDPATGGSGNGTFGGVGNLVDFGGGDTSLTLSLGAGSTIDFTARDCCITGDAFGLIVDGVATPWTTETFPGGVGGNFIGFIDDLFLAAGNHSLQLIVTHDCCGFGGMDWTMSAARAAVPEPAVLGLLAVSLLGVAAARARIAKR